MRHTLSFETTAAQQSGWEHELSARNAERARQIQEPMLPPMTLDELMIEALLQRGDTAAQGIRESVKRQIAADIDAASEEKLAEYVRVKEGRGKDGKEDGTLEAKR